MALGASSPLRRTGTGHVNYAASKGGGAMLMMKRIAQIEPYRRPSAVA